jgi:hypothetical protein
MAESSVSKRLGLFDHINAVTSVQDPNYFKKISDEDKKSWSNYMIIRYLSMSYELIETIGEIQSLIQEMEPEILYKTLIDLIPKKKYYLKWMKGKKTSDYEDFLYDIMVKEYTESKEHIEEYIDILYETRSGREHIQSLCEKYGVDKKEITKLKLKI